MANLAIPVIEQVMGWTNATVTTGSTTEAVTTTGFATTDDNNSTFPIGDGTTGDDSAAGQLFVFNVMLLGLIVFLF